MAFNLKKVLRALLFSSNHPLAIKDIQVAFTRFHETAMSAGAAAVDANAPAPVATEEEETEGEMQTPEAAELYAEVPTLVTATQIREAMDELAAELRADDDSLLLIEGATGYRLVTHPRFARWIRVLRNEPPPVRLSRSAVETLAIVAYRQPV
ncbi:MAG: SMC-Scp complex subunit ScpB, partial [Opitutaceae bacterium]|nr:SMC-Scp complex subunit ScpB [Opitutaceae bacterium]